MGTSQSLPDNRRPFRRRAHGPVPRSTLLGIGTLLVVASLTTMVHAQEFSSSGLTAERIAVVQFVNNTETEQWNLTAQQMSETIRLTVALSGRYDVAFVPPLDTNPYGPDAPRALRRLAQAQRLDAVVIGRISPLDNDRVELEAAVWSAFDGTIIGRVQREAFGSFDLLEAADELVVVASSALVGYRVDFGALAVEPGRTGVAYRVYIDGVPVGDNTQVVPRVLVGRRRIDVTVGQGGAERLVYSADRAIRPGEAIDVRFNVPQVTRREQDAIDALHGFVRSLLGQPERAPLARAALAESGEILGRAGGGAIAATLTAEQERLVQIWALEAEAAQLERLIVDVTIARRDLTASPVASWLPDTVRAVEANVGDEAVRERVTRNGAALYGLMRLQWAAALRDGAWDEAERALRHMETVVDTFAVGHAEHDVGRLRREFDRARSSAADVDRARRPLPFFTLAVGLGGAGFGGYLWAVEDGASTVGIDDAYAPAIQWGSLAVGGVTAIVSTAAIIRNAAAEQNAMRAWAREHHAREINVVDTFVETWETREPSDAVVLVIGPTDVVAHHRDGPVTLPTVVVQPAGRTIDVGRPWIVPADGTRLHGPGASFAVVR